jgi:hypothetical protein
MTDLSNLGEWKRAGRERRYCCPVCGDKEFHLYVNTQKEVYNCFRCGAKGRIKNIQFESHREIVEKPKAKVKTDGRRVDLFGPSWIQGLASTYWLNRGYTIQEALHYGIKVNIDIQTISIPVHSEDGVFGFYLERAIFPGSFKRYLIPSDVKVAEFMFNFHRAKDLPEICLVEGTMDAMAIGDMGVCLFGKSLHQAQLEKMRKYLKAKMVYVWLDQDAKKEAIQTRDKLIPWFRVQLVSSGKKDASQLRQDNGTDAVKQAIYHSSHHFLV